MLICRQNGVSFRTFGVDPFTAIASRPGPGPGPPLCFLESAVAAKYEGGAYALAAEAAAADPLWCDCDPDCGVGLAAKLRRLRPRWLPLFAAATESTVKMSRHRGGGGGATVPFELAPPLTL